MTLPQPETPPPPTFNFDGFAFEQISLRVLQKTPLAEGETLQPGIACDFIPRAVIEMDYDNRRAGITLGFQIRSDPKKQPYVIDITIFGRFSLATGTIEDLEQFAKGGATSLLFPFIRQMVHAITRDARWGPLLIHPINLQTILKWQEETPENVSASTVPAQPPAQSPSDEPGSTR